ncbi:MAG: FAD-binding protein [Paenacidovorax caeni]
MCALRCCRPRPTPSTPTLPTAPSCTTTTRSVASCTRASEGPDQLRTCAPAPLQKPGAGPFIAIQMQLITRKSLGGLQTDLHSRVLDGAGQPIDGLYCVGEAAGFGGGGANGKRSLEGAFCPAASSPRAQRRAITGRAGA